MPGYRLKYFGIRIIVIGILIAFLSSCNDANQKKKIIYINSYHQGFPPSNQITKGVMENLPADSFEIKAFFMDTKRNPAKPYIKQKAAELLDSIKIIEPDVLIVSDDNAMKYLVVPNFQNNNLPIVFCGINWTADQYNVSEYNLTGTLEILSVAELIQKMKVYYPGMKKILVLNENTTTSRKTQPLLDTLLGNLGMEVSQTLVDNFEQWKTEFTAANDSFDIIYLQTKGAIKGWEDNEAENHIKQFIKIPLVTCEEFMMPFSVFGLTQLSEEQGIKAAEMTKKILNGTDPADIPISRNNMSKVWLNVDLAQRIEFEPDEKLLKNATLIK